MKILLKIRFRGKRDYDVSSVPSRSLRMLVSLERRNGNSKMAG